jgi:hypothetical protein
MKRSNRVLALFSLALALACTAGCIAPTGDEDPGLIAEEAQALSHAPGASDAPTFEVIPRGDGSYRVVSVGAVDMPAGAIWSKLQNMEQIVPIALAGTMSDFAWVDGGSPGKVPSQFQFTLFGATLLEEIFYRNHEEHILQYRLLTPALGIVGYIGTLELDEDDAGRTVITYTRDLRFADPSLVGPITASMEPEMAKMQAYFAKGSK